MAPVWRYMSPYWKTTLIIWPNMKARGQKSQFWNFSMNWGKFGNGLFQKKSKQAGLRIYFFENPHGIFQFLTLLLEVSDKTKLNPWIFHKLCLIPCKFQGQKQRPLEIPHYFFLVTLGNSTSFLINPWKFHMLFLWYPWKFHILNPLFGFFLE